MMEENRRNRAASYWNYPYTHYRELQRESPIWYDPYLEAWLVTSHSAALEALHHPNLSSAWLAHRADLRGSQSASAKYVYSVLSRWFVLIDAPEHPTLRKAVSRAFTPRAIAALKPFISARVEALLAAALARDGAVDAMTDLATPLSAGVIVHLLGLNTDIESRVPGWGAVLAKYLASTARLDMAEQTAAVVGELSDALTEIISSKSAPKGSVLDELIQADWQRSLSVKDIVSTVAFLLYAGLEATSNAIGLACLSLVRHAHIRAELRSCTTPEMIGSAVEELLRYDTSVLQVPRVAMTDLILHGQRIGKDEVVVVVLGAANHDEQRFPNPDALELHRENSFHLAFGHGAHFCIGAALARAELAMFLVALLRVAPEFDLAGPPRWSQRNAVRTLESVPIILVPGRKDR